MVNPTKTEAVPLCYRRRVEVLARSLLESIAVLVASSSTDPTEICVSGETYDDQN